MTQTHNLLFMMWLVFMPIGLFYVINTWTMTPETIGYKATLFFANVITYYVWLYAFVTNLREIMYQEVLKEAEAELRDTLYDEIREQVEQDLQAEQDEKSAALESVPVDEQNGESDSDKLPALESVPEQPIENQVDEQDGEGESNESEEDSDSDDQPPKLVDIQSTPTEQETIPIAVPL